MSYLDFQSSDDQGSDVNDFFADGGDLIINKGMDWKTVILIAGVVGVAAFALYKWG